MRRAVLLVVVLAGVACLSLMIGDVHRLITDALHGDTPAVRRDLDVLGPWAVVVLVVAIIVHNVVPIPAEILNGAAGYAFGVSFGIPLCLAAWLLSGLVGYAIAAEAGRPIADRLAGAERLDRLERIVERGGRRTLLVARLIPLLPFTAINFVCGLARVPLGRFAWTTVVGFAPLTILCVVLGARLQSPHLDDPVLVGSFVALIALVVLTPVVSRRLSAT